MQTFITIILPHVFACSYSRIFCIFTHSTQHSLPFDPSGHNGLPGSTRNSANVRYVYALFPRVRAIKYLYAMAHKKTCFMCTHTKPSTYKNTLCILYARNATRYQYALAGAFVCFLCSCTPALTTCLLRRQTLR